MKVYPKTKVSISLLLPTKISYLNFRVNQLNNGIKRLAANSRNINVIEHSNLVDQFGFLNPVLGRHKRGLPNPDDHVHLGPNGIKRFVLNIKTLFCARNHNLLEVMLAGTRLPLLHPQALLEPSSILILSLLHPGLTLASLLMALPMPQL